MLDWIVKYWLEVAFGLVCAALAWFAKRYVKLAGDEKKNHESEIIEAIQDKMDSQYEKTQEQMNECYNRLDRKISDFISDSREEDKKIYDNISSVKGDVLTIEGAYFRSECRKLLRKDHIITEEEFNTITVEHGAYNGLGGNHEGDALYEMVKEKHKGQLFDSTK